MPDKKVAIITGASKGIGLALAKIMASEGYQLCLAFRDMNLADEVRNFVTLSEADLILVKADVSVQEDCKMIVEQCLQKFGRLDILVNNAGITMRGLFHQLKPDAFKKVVDVNFWGTVWCTYYAMPYLLQRKGVVMGVSSIAGFKGLPTRTAYSASKFAMEGFLDALRTENLETGVDVLVFRPGFTATNIRNSALSGDESKTGNWEKKEVKEMTAESVAQLMFEAIEKRKNGIVLTLNGKLAWFLNKWFPNWVSRLFLNHVKKEEGSPLKQ
ncbi:MAG: SDR family oxidoreductase [Flavobacteriales bacterium]